MDAIGKITASGQSGMPGGPNMVMTTKKFGARMTNTFTSNVKRTTRKPLTTLKAGGDVIEDTNVDENSVKIISLIKNFILSIQSESKLAFSIQKQGILILKQIKIMKGSIHKNVFGQLSGFKDNLESFFGEFDKMIAKVETTFMKFSQSEITNIAELKLNIKTLDESGQGLIDNEGNSIAETSEFVLEISIQKAQKMKFLTSSILESIVSIENIGDGFASSEEKKSGEVNCGSILTKIKSVKELMQKEKMIEVEAVVAELVYDIETKTITNIKKSVKELIRISSDFKQIQKTATSSLALYQSEYKSLKGQTLDVQIEIDQQSGKLVTQGKDGSVIKTEETLMQEMTLQFVQIVKSKNSVSILQKAILNAKSGGATTGRKVKFSQFSQILEEILSLYEEDIASSKVQNLVMKIIKLSKGKFSTSLTSVEEKMLTESMEVVEKVITKTEKFYESLKISMKEISGEEVDESSYEIETIDENGGVLVGGAEQKFMQSKVVIKQKFSNLVMKQSLMSTVLNTLTILKTMKGGKEVKKEKSKETKSFKSIISKVEGFIQLFEEESNSTETMEELVATIVQFSKIVVGSSKSSSKKISQLSKTITEKKAILDRKIATQKEQIEQKLGSKISIEKLGLSSISESTGEIETSTKFETSQIESMNMEYISYSKSSDSLTKLSVVLTEISSNKGASGTNGETTTAEEFIELVSELTDLLEISSTEANIQKYCKMLIFMAKGKIEMSDSDLESLSAFSEIITKKEEEIRLSLAEIESVYEETFTTKISAIKSTILFISEDGSGFVQGDTSKAVQDDETSGVVRVNLKMQTDISSIVQDIMQYISRMFRAKQDKKKGRTCNNFKRKMKQLKKELDDESPREKKLKNLRKWFNKKKTLRFCKKSDKESLKTEITTLKTKRNELLSKASLLQEKVFSLEGKDVSKQDESAEKSSSSSQESSSGSSQQTISSSSQQSSSSSSSQQVSSSSSQQSSIIISQESSSSSSEFSFSSSSQQVSSSSSQLSSSSSSEQVSISSSEQSSTSSSSTTNMMTSGLVSDTLEETRVLSSLSNDFIQLTRTGDILTKCISAINALKSASTSDTSKKTYSFSEIQISVKKLFRIIRSSLTSGDTQTVGISLLKMLNSNVKDVTGKVEQLTTIATKMTKFNERVVSSLTKLQETAETFNGEKFSSSEILLITEDGSGFTDQAGAELFVQKSKAVLTSKLHILAQNTDAVEKALSIITMQSEKEDQEEEEDEEEGEEGEKLKRKEKKSRKSVGFKKFLTEIKKFSTSIKEIT